MTQTRNLKTASTHALRERAARAIESGAEFTFETPGRVAVKIGYVAGGGMVRVEVRDLLSRPVPPVASLTRMSTQLAEQLTLFVEQAQIGAAPYMQSAYDEAVAVVAESAQELAAAAAQGNPEDAAWDVEAVRALNDVRRAVLALLDHPEDV